MSAIDYSSWSWTSWLPAWCSPDKRKRPRSTCQISRKLVHLYVLCARVVTARSDHLGGQRRNVSLLLLYFFLSLLFRHVELHAKLTTWRHKAMPSDDLAEQKGDTLEGLCKFSFVVDMKWDFVWTTMLKQARWAKPEVTCSWIYVTTHSKPSEDWRE